MEGMANEDYLELQDPTVREHIRTSHEEHLTGKSRPAEEFLRELREEAVRQVRRTEDRDE